MKIKDVAIIGAGASGSTAAFHLSNKGHDVVLLEKHQKSSAKICGGGMASSVQKWFPFDLTPVVDGVINKVEFTFCLNDSVIAELPGASPFWIVQRQNLDSFLIDKAINEGSEFLSNFNVIKLQKRKNIWFTSSLDGREIQSRAIVIADGSSSPWPKKFNLGPRKVNHASTCSIQLKGNGNMNSGTAKFEFGLVKNGFAWAFPLKKGVNIGFGSFIGHKKIFTPENTLDKLLINLGFCPSESMFKEAKLRIWNGNCRLDGDGIVVVGDAASLCDPFLAEGIRPALMSGYEAANTLNYWLKGYCQDLTSYSLSMKKKWGESMLWGKRISQIFYRFPKVGYNLGIKRPTAPKRIAQILSGEMGYSEIAERVIKRLILKR